MYEDKSSAEGRLDDRKPAEEWAKAKGHLRLFEDGSADPSLEDYWKYRAGALMANWPAGFELSEAEYDAAIKAAENVEVRG